MRVKRTDCVERLPSREMPSQTNRAYRLLLIGLNDTSADETTDREVAERLGEIHPTTTPGLTFRTY